MKTLLSTTGYVRGGCSPFAMKKVFPTIIDQSIEEVDKVYVSGGKLWRYISMLLIPRRSNILLTLSYTWLLLQQDAFWHITLTDLFRLTDSADLYSPAFQQLLFL